MFPLTRARTVSVVMTGLAGVLMACGGDSATSYSLAGPSWRLQEYANPADPTGMTTVLSSAIPTLTFGEGDVVNAFGGCNNFHGAYTVSGESLTLGPFAATMMYCSEEEGLMDQESAFLVQMDRVVGYRIDGDELHLLDDAGDLVALLKAQ